MLNDKQALCYFIQFLEVKNALALVKFWLDAESFRTVTESPSLGKNKYRFHSNLTLNESGEDAVKRPLVRSVSSDGYDSLSYYSLTNTSSYSLSENFDEVDETFDETDNCKLKSDLKFNDLENLQKSLTDDEKSKICEKNRLASTKETSRILDDALRIYRKYLVTSSFYFVELPATILSNLSLALCSSNESENCWDSVECSQIFQDAQNFVLDLLDRNYLAEFLDSSFYAKYTIEVLTSSTLKLRDILHSESALFYFMEFLEQDTKRNLLEFWLVASNFRKQVKFSGNLKIGSEILVNSEEKSEILSEESESAEKKTEKSGKLSEKPEKLQEKSEHPGKLEDDKPEEPTKEASLNQEDSKALQSDALVIYEKYFSLQATNPLSLPQKVRLKVEETICSPETIALSFDLPICLVEEYLEKCCLTKFLKSQLFFKYLAELMGKVQDTKKEVNGIMKVNRHRKTFSDCTGEKIKPIRNTLLAMETRTKQSDMQIDSRKIYNADLLWHRPRNGLSFGRVDSMGRYERDFDMNPGTSHCAPGKPVLLNATSLDDPNALLENNKWNTIRIKNAVRKLVHLPPDKVQEEIAWQVAEMIVKDVTSVTMNKSINK